MAKTTKKLTIHSNHEPMVLLPLKQYESLIEDIEDRLTAMERKDEPELTHEEVEKRFTEIFDKR